MMKASHERYDKIGINYDDTRKADPYLVDRMHQFIKASMPGNYIDVGCGTGNYTSALQDKGLNFTGVDPSDEMLNIARRKNPEISWIKGSAEDLPVRENFYDGALVSLSIHHWKDLTIGFQKIASVLKKNAKLVLFTTLPEQTRAYWLSHYFPQMIEDSIDVLPTLKQIEKAFQNAGLSIQTKEKYLVQPDLQDLFLYAGKHNPQLYFDKEVRKGISSFSLLSRQEEVATGLDQLRKDVESGDFETIRKKHENSLGDYLFIVAQK